MSDLADANFIIFQPANYSDPNALATGYCAFHDYLYPNVEGGIYDSQYTSGVESTQYTNLPYLLDIHSSGINVCGENAVNSGAAGKLDGYSIALGHEIMETATDPGAEDVIGSGTSATDLGGWYDTIDADENGDKCAWVGENPATDTGPPSDPGRDGRHHGQRRPDLRGPVAVVKQRSRRRRLLRRRRHRPAAAVAVRSRIPGQVPER